MKHLLTVLLAMCFFITARAQAPQNLSSSDILLGLKKLNVVGSVLYVAAHPDDENTRLLAYLSKEKLYRTGYLSLTRGDGGQNLIGDEQGVSLGLIRTQELLAARRVDGAEQFFTRAFDFGFSKSTEEAMKVWEKEKILSDVVWVIRNFRPDVIIARFPEDNRAGHGHHSASAVLAHEAFVAAADVKRFPEQLKYVKVWQAKRILWNTFNFGGNNTTSNSQFKIDVGGYNALLGKNYGELAAESRSQHKSQGFGVPRQRGESFEFFEHVEGEKLSNDLMDGVITTWARSGKNNYTRFINEMIKNYQSDKPAETVNALLQLRTLLQNDTLKKDENYWQEKKLTETEALIKACKGIYFEAVANQQMAVTGDSLKLTLNFINRSSTPVQQVKITVADTTVALTSEATSNKLFSTVVTYIVKDSFMSDQPYWLREQMSTGSFNVNMPLLIGYAQNPGNKVSISYKIEAQSFNEKIGLQYKYTDPVKGEIYQPVITVPPIVVGVQPGVVLNNLLPRHPQFIQLNYKSYTQLNNLKGNIKFELEKAVSMKEKNMGYGFVLQKNNTQSIVIPFDSLFAKEKPQAILPFLQLQQTGKTVGYNNAMKLIQYDHIPTVHYFFTNTIKVINEEIKIAGKNIGYITGSGDAVPEALQQMGFNVTILNDKDLAGADLSRFDAIITGVRAYNVKESLNNSYNRLMQYVEEGGNLIVQYNTSSQIGPVKAKMSPYPFTISRARITDEKATVTFLKPEHAVLNYPNKITQKDFEGWLQERSIYHAGSIDKNYETIFSMADPGEPADEGSIIIGKYGKGYFVYTGIVFFRELPAGVAGAYRLMANIIALNQKRGF
jgi:LmbE family N-acetylglucosaminyl deacetylase